MCEIGPCGLLVVLEHGLAIEDRIAAIPAILVAHDRHERRLSRGLVGGMNGAKRAGQVGVTVQNEKMLAEQGQCLLDGSAGTEQRRTVEGVRYRHPECASVADGGANLLAQVTHAQHDAPDALGFEQIELMKDERAPRDAHERLGHQRT